MWWGIGPIDQFLEKKRKSYFHLMMDLPDRSVSRKEEKELFDYEFEPLQ